MATVIAFVQTHKLISKSGIAACLASAVIPLAVTGLLLFRFAAQRSSVDELLIWVVVTVFAAFPAQIIVNIQTNKYYERRLAGDDAPPTQALRLLYGAALGLIAALSGLALALLWAYFAM